MTVTTAGTQLAYRGILATHRDAMVKCLVEEHDVNHAVAELMIDQLWDRLVSRLMKDYAHQGVDLPLAERIMNEALGFLQLCSRSAGHGPSPLVDMGWHTFIQYTLEYAAFCKVIAGHFIHHLPEDVIGLNAPSARACSKPIEPQPSPFPACHNKPGYGRPSIQEGHTTEETVAAMMELGPVDRDLWSKTI